MKLELVLQRDGEGNDGSSEAGLLCVVHPLLYLLVSKKVGPAHTAKKNELAPVGDGSASHPSHHSLPFSPSRLLPPSAPLHKGRRKRYTST